MSGNEVRTPSNWPAIDNSLIAGNYKLRTRTDNTDPKGDGTKEFVINWPSAYKFVSCFIANFVASTDSNKRMGQSHIWAGDDVTPYSSSLRQCSGEVYDTGFYALT